MRDPAQRAISQFSFQLTADATPASFIVNNNPGKCTAESLNAHIHAVLGSANASLSRLEGEWPHSRTVLIEFPTDEAVHAFFDSDGYRAIVGHRHAAARSDIAIVSGFG